jgi:hypothetical protein
LFLDLREFSAKHHPGALLRVQAVGVLGIVSHRFRDADRLVARDELGSR